MPRRSTMAQVLKAKAKGMFLAGLSPTDVQKELKAQGHEVAIGTLKHWKLVLLTPEEWRQADEAAGELIQDALIEGLRESIKATTSIAKTFQDEEYNKKHPPSELMDAFEGLSSWQVRSLHAMQSAAEAGVSLDEGGRVPEERGLAPGHPDGEAIPAEPVFTEAETEEVAT